MALSKKHFIAIAEQFRAQVSYVCAKSDDFRISADERAIALGALNELAANLCNTFAEENPNFDRARFLKACGF